MIPLLDLKSDSRHEKIIIATILCFCCKAGQGQDPWIVEAKNIDPKNYFGVTVANGQIGLVSSPVPMKVKDVVLNGAYDYYQRGRVSNILKTFNHVNMNLDVDGQRISQSTYFQLPTGVGHETSALTTSFDVQDKVSVSHSLMALRHLPYTALTIIEIKAKKGCSDYTHERY